jgi:hypothetical protein
MSVITATQEIEIRRIMVPLILFLKLSFTFLSVLGFELRTLHLLGRSSTA